MRQAVMMGLFASLALATPAAAQWGGQHDGGNWNGGGWQQAGWDDDRWDDRRNDRRWDNRGWNNNGRWDGDRYCVAAMAAPARCWALWLAAW
jgi:hypothetical protein